MANFMYGQYGAPGENLVTITTPGGHTVQVNAAAAPNFQGFLSDLEQAGAPVSALGGYDPRNIAGTNKTSQHAYGNAVDVDQSSRNTVSPAFQKWANDNEGTIAQASQKWGIENGGTWKSPDFGHFEWNGTAPPAMAPDLPAPQNVGMVPTAAPTPAPSVPGLLSPSGGGGNPALSAAASLIGAGATPTAAGAGPTAAAQPSLSSIIGLLGKGSGGGNNPALSAAGSLLQAGTTPQQAPQGAQLTPQMLAAMTAPIRTLPLNIKPLIGGANGGLT